EYIEVFTNATCLGDGLLREWASLGARAAVSFYSCDPATHDSITRRPGSFEQTVQGIKALLSRQIPVRIAIVLMRENLSHLRGTVEFLMGLGLRDVDIGHDFVRPTGRGVAEVALLDRDVAKEVSSIKPRWQSTWAIARPPLPKDEQVVCGKNFAQGTCWKGAIAISSEGKVYPCIFARQLPVGKLPETGLEEIVKSQNLQRLWQITLEEVKTCKDCELRFGCFDCRALAQTITGDLLSKNPHCRYNPYTGLIGGNGGRGLK
ncbi:MAG: SPASM domain-containing protein, partial [Candidatus Brocadiales bacterium]